MFYCGLVPIEFTRFLQDYRAQSQYKDCLSGYVDFCYKNKTVVRPSFLYNGNAYTGKTVSLMRWPQASFY